MSRELTTAQAILEATDQSMLEDDAVFVIGLGVCDSKGIFGTTLGLKDKYGPNRIMEMPVSENAMTGIVIGSALRGMRPILTHQRVDFMLLSLDQIINNAAKWHYMFGGQMNVPIVIRIIVGRGWGQGPQHSQSLQAIFGHIPGLKVVMPFSPYDAKGMLISAIKDPNPVIFIEHRWLHSLKGVVPERPYGVPLGKANILHQGNDLTIVSTSHMTLEALKAREILKHEGIDLEVVDLRSIRPLDEETILKSVEKTGHLIVADDACRFLGLPSEIISIVTEKRFSYLKKPPCRITLPDAPTPTSWKLVGHYYPRAIHIINAAKKMFGLAETSEEKTNTCSSIPFDVPDSSFSGPF